MAKYFHLSHGLRGCYVPDGEPSVIMCRTRRELKASIVDEIAMLDSDRAQGFSNRALASFAAECWREAHKAKPAYLPYALPYKEPEESGYHNAIFVSVATRREYLEHCKETDQ
jgi:hypothetical protein